MSVRVYLSGNPEHDRVLRAFHYGCPWSAELVPMSEYKPSAVAVVFGVRKKHVPISWPRGEIIQRQRDKNLDVVILETGYVNRGGGSNHHYAVGLNGLNGRAEFRNKGMPGDRAAKLGVTLKPWREDFDTNHVVLCAQVPWDASVDNTNHLDWLADAAKQLTLNTERPVLFRPHPLAQLEPLPGLGYSTEPIETDMERAHCVVTYNSNSAVEAVTNGVPAIAVDRGSMAWDVSGHSIEDVEEPPTPEREQWLADLAYAQWTPEEMAEGRAWRHLFA